jgi:hypothetical protein
MELELEHSPLLPLLVPSVVSTLPLLAPSVLSIRMPAVLLAPAPMAIPRNRSMQAL